MDFDWTDEQIALRRRVHDYLADNLSESLMRSLHEGESIVEEVWTDEVRTFDAGMMANGWQAFGLPEEYGGIPMSAMDRLIILSEVDYGNAPRFARATAVSVAPTFAKLATEDNKAKWLRKLLTGEVTVSIGYSEPSAGSDLAALTTRALLEGDAWVINGQKTWNSRGHLASHTWLLARTGDPDGRHRGLSVFLVPLDAPGVEIQRVESWGDHVFNDVFFSDVRIPQDHLIGQPGQGWSIVMDAVNGERAFLGFSYGLKAILDEFIDYCRTTSFDGEILGSRDDVKLALAKFSVDIELAHLVGLDIASQVDAGIPTDSEALGLKIFTSELRTQFADFALQTMGLPGLLNHCDPVAPIRGDMELLYRRAPINRIGVGANEILRDVVAQRGLGLPRAT